RTIPLSIEYYCSFSEICSRPCHLMPRMKFIYRGLRIRYKCPSTPVSLYLRQPLQICLAVSHLPDPIVAVAQVLETLGAKIQLSNHNFHPPVFASLPHVH